MHARPARRRLVALVLLAFATIAGACTDGETDATAATSTTIARPSTVLRIGVEDWPTCLNPLTCADDVLHEQVLQHVLPAAFEVDGSGDYVPSPLMVTSPEISETEDGIEIRYELSTEARWADGRPITSTDFLGTWRAVMDTPGADRTGYDRIVAVDDADPSVALVTLDGPVVDWQELFGGARGFLLQADAFGPSTDLTGRFNDELPIAGGPYVLTRWDDNGAVLSATEPWEGVDAASIDQVRLDRVEIDGLGDPMTFDLLVPGAGSDVSAPEGFEARITPSTRVLGVWFDQREPTLSPLAQRQALELLLDRGELADLVGSGEPVACPGWVPEIGPWCDAATTDRPAPDQELAAFLLFEQGWLAGEDGILAGPFGTFQVPVTYDPALPGTGDVADAIAEAFSDIGVDASVGERPTADWRTPRALDDSTGVGVFALDLGFSPRVGDLYGCPSGPESSLVGACPEAVVAAANTLASTSGEDALESVASLGRAVAGEVLWLPIGRLSERSFLRPGRVDTSDAGGAVGGPLAGLERFEADE